MTNLWGIHNDTLTNELVDHGFVSVGWHELGDLRTISNGRDGLKKALDTTYPGSKARATAGRAGILARFRDEIQIGDLVVAPYKPDSTINVGEVTGPYYFETSASTHVHRRPVRWIKIGLPRTAFSQSALYEVGSLLTVFRVRKHSDEFLAAVQARSADPAVVERAVETVATQLEDDDSPDEPRASRIRQHTMDFVKEALLHDISPQEFEEFTAALLRTLGSEARVTRYSQDGGVDVVAHKDPLGVEPPLIKVQCKQSDRCSGAPDVQRLVGTQGIGEHSLFVNLGSYSRDAIAIERTRPGLRLLNGDDLVELVLKHYSSLPEEWRAKIPLTPVLVVSDVADL